MTGALALALSALLAVLPCPDGDLRCIQLLPTAGYPEASGTVELRRAPSPFGAAVDREGHHRFDLILRIEGLAEPAAFVAWATTPTLDPMVRLGPVGNGETLLGPVALDKFLILVTAEPAGAGSGRPAGPTVLRGTSPSMALQPHELPAMLAMAAGGEPSSHEGHAGPSGWTPPPMHPGAPMPAGLHRDAPDVAPYLPLPSPAALPEVRPTETLRLADGDSLELIAGPVRRTVDGRAFALYGFNGSIPGPLIRVDRGATITVGFTNRTGLPTTVHWHGVRLDNAFDGVPHVTQEPVPPGGTFRYEVHFPDAGLYWYHPHHREDILQDLGLYGNLRVDASEPGYWNPVSREEHLVLDDLLIGEEGLVPYGREAATHALMGRFGNVLLVNGEPGYRLQVDQYAIVRFFLTNVSATRTFNVSFGEAAIKLVASDVGRFEREDWVESVAIAPAERYVVEVLFETPGEVAVTNRVRAIDHLNGRFFPEIDTLGMVAVSAGDIQNRAAAFRQLRVHDDVSAEIDGYRSHFDRPPDRELVLTMEADSLPFPLGMLLRLERAYFNPVEWSGTMPVMNWATTARQVRWILRDPATGKENQEIDWRFRQGDVLKLRLTNSADALHAMQHPIHLHGQRFLVLSQGGVPNENRVWKDTLLVPAGEAADILVDLSNPGRWMLHCHIAEHLEAGMQTIITVEPE